MMRVRTVWIRRLRLYPLLVIPALVWVSFGNNVAARQGGRDLITAPSQEGHAAGHAVAAAPNSVLFRFESGPLEEFTVILTTERR